MSCLCTNYFNPHKCFGCDYNCAVRVKTNEPCSCSACQSLKGFSFGQLPIGSTTFGVKPMSKKKRRQ